MMTSHNKVPGALFSTMREGRVRPYEFHAVTTNVFQTTKCTLFFVSL